ncbi:MAG: hypothetical protein JWN37_451 [Candidatus Nomurabacteria bacterium]|nr:hypothetical protein [Candidatus Nomurabacteria bacterium]
MQFNQNQENREPTIDVKGDPERFLKDEIYREETIRGIKNYLQKDWFEYAETLAKNVGMSNEDFEKLANSNPPNPRLIA